MPELPGQFVLKAAAAASYQSRNIQSGFFIGECNVLTCCCRRAQFSTYTTAPKFGTLQKVLPPEKDFFAGRSSVGEMHMVPQNVSGSC